MPTCAELQADADKIYAALIGGHRSVTIGDRSVVYRDTMQDTLNLLNRQIARCAQAKRGATPGIKTPSFGGCSG